MATREMDAAEWGRLCGLAALWGGSFFFNAVAVAELPPLTAVCGRVTIAAALLLAATRWLGPAPPLAWGRGRRSSSWARSTTRCRSA